MIKTDVITIEKLVNRKDTHPIVRTTVISLKNFGKDDIDYMISHGLGTELTEIVLPIVDKDNKLF